MATNTLSAYAAILSYPVKYPETLSYTVTWSNLGPLTTVFTPPASCNSPVATNLFVQGRTTWAHECGWIRTADVPRSDCYPSYTAATPSVIDGDDNFWLPGEKKFYYSPGYSCPAAWQTATVLTTPAPATIGIWDEAQRPLALLDAAGTQVICCPSAWTLGVVAQCYSRVETSTTLGICREQTRSANHTNRPTQVSATTSTMVAYTTPAVLLYYESAQGKKSTDNISKTAIGVVVPLVLLLAALATVLFWLRRRKRRQRHQQAGAMEHIASPATIHGYNQGSVMLDDNSAGDHVAFAKPELEACDPSRELLTHTKAELPGSYPPLLPKHEASEVKDTNIAAPFSRNEIPVGRLP